MTAHGIRIEQLLGSAQELEPTLEPHPRVVPHRLALLLIVIAVALVVVLGHEGLASAAHTVCTIGEPAGTSCVDSIIHSGYP